MSKLPHVLSKTDARFVKWKESLKNRPPPWNKGQTKDSHPGVLKISKARRKKDNFANWRLAARNKGIIPKDYPKFKRDDYLAFLVGITLGDGHIQKFPRTERLIISLGTDKPKLISCTSEIVKYVFSKPPTIQEVTGSNVVRVNLYQKFISSRLQIPSGSRQNIKINFPKWIWKNNMFLIACLRGLFEADGSLSVHLPTYTYNFQFSNRNRHLLDEVEKGIKSLGLHPERRIDSVRLRKKKEVKYFEKLINFRNYNAGWSNGSLVALWKRRSRFKS